MNRETILSELNRRGLKAVPHNVVKNGVELQGISIEDKVPISPVFYVEDVLKKAEQEEQTLNEMIDDLIININNCDFTFNEDDLQNRNYILDGILIGMQREGREDIVKNLSDEFKGIEMYLYIRKEIASNQMFYIKMSKSILENAEISEEEAWAKAEENTFSESDLFSMTDILLKAADEYNFEISDQSNEMYILTNKIRAKGASAILNKKLLVEFAVKFKVKKIVAIPSSIHEFIIMPYKDDIDINAVNRIIRNVNSVEVDPIEQLGDFAYIVNIKIE